MTVLERIYILLATLILVVTAIVVALLILRTIIAFANVNPFSRWVMTVRRWTDPMVEPVRRTLMSFRVSYKIAPLICLGIALLLGYVAIEFVFSVLITIASITRALRHSKFVAAAGFLLYGLLALYSALLIIRIITSWGRGPGTNIWLRRLGMITDPILIPLRRRIPPVGMVDISALVAFLIIWILQQIVAATLLRGQFLGW
jgi:YggT family protein